MEEQTLSSFSFSLLFLLLCYLYFLLSIFVVSISSVWVITVQIEANQVRILAVESFLKSCTSTLFFFFLHSIDLISVTKLKVPGSIFLNSRVNVEVDLFILLLPQQNYGETASLVKIKIDGGCKSY